MEGTVLPEQKAEYVTDDAGARIMKATTSLDCYKIGWELNSNLDLNAWQSGSDIKAMT